MLGARVARVCLPSVPTQLRGDEPRGWSVAGRVTVPRAVGGSSRPSIAFFGIRGPASQTGTTRRPPEGHQRSSGTCRWRAGDSHPRTATRPGVVHRPQRTGNVRDAVDCRSSRFRLQPSAIPLLIVCDEVDFPGVMVLAKENSPQPSPTRSSPNPRHESDSVRIMLRLSARRSSRGDTEHGDRGDPNCSVEAIAADRVGEAPCRRGGRRRCALPPIPV